MLKHHIQYCLDHKWVNYKHRVGVYTLPIGTQSLITTSAQDENGLSSRVLCHRKPSYSRLTKYKAATVSHWYFQPEVFTYNHFRCSASTGSRTAITRYFSVVTSSNPDISAKNVFKYLHRKSYGNINKMVNEERRNASYERKDTTIWQRCGGTTRRLRRSGANVLHDSFL